MRFRIETHKLTLRSIGWLVAIIGCALILAALFQRSWIPAFPGVAALVAGLWLQRSNGLLVRRPAGAVLEQLERTLELMSVRHSRETHRVLVAATGTAIAVRRLGVVSLVTFTFAEGGSVRERYIRDTVIKFQRFTARD